MQIRFQGNYNVIGSNRANVLAKLNELDSQSQLAIGNVYGMQACSGDSCPVDAPKQYNGILLTDEDAVTFLKDQGLNVSLSASREENDTLVQTSLAEKTANNTLSGFMDALWQKSYMLRFLDENITEIKLEQ